MLELLFLTLLAMIFMFWLNQAQARDTVRATGKQVTLGKNMIFLDDSVILKKISIKPFFGKLSLLRIFQFEFSLPDSGRFRGIIKHHGGKVIEIQYFHETHIETLNM